MLGYEKSNGGLFLPVHGPIDERPQKVRVPVRNGKCNPDGAIIMHGATIGQSREFTEKHYRDRGKEVEFYEIP